jgi:hypothetical protein
MAGGGKAVSFPRFRYTDTSFATSATGSRSSGRASPLPGEPAAAAARLDVQRPGVGRIIGTEVRGNALSLSSFRYANTNFG